MDDIIKAILDIDNQAQMIEKDIAGMKEQAGREIQEEVKRLEAKLLAKAKDKIEQIMQGEAEDQKQQLENLEISMRQRLEKLDRIYNENKDKWIQEIVTKVCGV